MPAFSFEKIAPPAELEATGAVSPTVRRGALIRLLDRLTSARQRKSDDETGKVQEPKHKSRTQR
jgi:hypothetical protein